MLKNSSTIHFAFQEFARKNEIDLTPLLELGYLTLTLDEQYRIQIIPVEENELIICGRLCLMPDNLAKQEKIIDKAPNLAYINAREIEVYPALEPDQVSMTLQLRIKPYIKLWSFEKKLAQFVQQLDIWRKYLNKVPDNLTKNIKITT